MFQPIRHRLLWSNLAVLTAILVIFAVAVRLAFVYTLFDQMRQQVATLGRAAAAGAEFDSPAGTFQPDDDTDIQNLLKHRQALQWFNVQGKPVLQQGKYALTLPLPLPYFTQVQRQGDRTIGITIPIIDPSTKRLVGYVRASESMESFDRTLQNLDLGLGGGIVIALILSWIGGIWLTRQAMQPIEQSFQQLQQFAADASHELRSPLMAIKSNAAVALKYPEGMRVEDAEKFQAISSAIHQMTRLTEDLLFLARTEQMPAGPWERVNVTALLAELTQLYQPLAATKAIQLINPSSPSSDVTGDAAQLRRLFTNLIDNALYYTPQNGTVTVRAVRMATYLEVSVQDTGIGIAPEHLAFVFDRLWRAEQSRSHGNGGSGLGLAIAQTIAQHHGSRITVTSQLGVGSCFTVRLPVAI